MLRTMDETERRQRQLRAEMASGGYVLPGSIVERWTRCQNAGCKCRQEPPQLHGPYPTWTRKVGSKTVTRTLSPQQLELYRSWVEAGRRLRQLLADLESLSVELAERTEGWRTK
jgi:hypothetical protein